MAAAMQGSAEFLAPETFDGAQKGVAAAYYKLVHWISLRGICVEMGLWWGVFGGVPPCGVTLANSFLLCDFPKIGVCKLLDPKGLRVNIDSQGVSGYEGYWCVYFFSI